MPIVSTLWRVGKQPQQLAGSQLDSEQQLEDMIVAQPRLLSEDWMLIGCQEDTGYGGRIDLLAIEPDGSLVLIELKRNRTPRDVVAQTLDYANWMEALESEDIAQIYGRYKPNGNLSDDFRKRFGTPLDEETINTSHKLIIVASSLDDSTERIVSYLNKRDIPLNVLCFQIFQNGEDKLLSRTWLLDPVHTQANTVSLQEQSEPWNGEFYCSFGLNDNARSWQDAVEYGFISAGGGAWYSRTLLLLNRGDRIWVNIPKIGYVGVGVVVGQREPASTFRVTTPNGEIPVLDVVKRGTYLRNYIDDPERCEYFVPVRWLDTVPLQKAVQEIGLFGNQNSICKPTTPKWRTTVERLKLKFINYNK
ncbi:MAG: endonuclease NucS [Chloroflexi bacterium]|nr:endonuclease NucS [Chloroflexota bacterium]